MSYTWQAVSHCMEKAYACRTHCKLCHIAWQRPMHVGHMASHVCGTWQAMCVAHGKPCVWHMASHVCGTWHAMCVAHGMPCVIMHGLFETYKYGSSHLVWGVVNSIRGGSSKEKEEEGKREMEERRREREERK